MTFLPTTSVHLRLMMVVRMTRCCWQPSRPGGGCTYYTAFKTKEGLHILYSAECLSAVEHHHLHSVHKKSNVCHFKGSKHLCKRFSCFCHILLCVARGFDALPCHVFVQLLSLAVYTFQAGGHKVFILFTPPLYFSFQAGAHKDESNIPEMQNTTMIWGR